MSTDGLGRKLAVLGRIQGVPVVLVLALKVYYEVPYFWEADVAKLYGMLSLLEEVYEEA